MNFIETIKEYLKLPTEKATKQLMVFTHNVAIDNFLERKKNPQLLLLPENDRLVIWFFSEFDIFIRVGIPFIHWSEIAKEGLTLLKEMIENNDLNYKNNPKFAEFKKRVSKKQNDLAYLVHGDWLGH